MGLTRFYPVSQRNDPSGLDAFGTRAYGIRDFQNRFLERD